ncbi:hypothetical protein [Acinetobacter sp.]|uniref:hypothetical protein n=1 Tax=Acinetobacter sp. TaxID=472 RepID=UPI0035AE91BC
MRSHQFFMALAAGAALTASSFTAAAAVVHTLDFPEAKADQDCSAQQNTVKAKAKPVSGIAD